MNLPLALIKRYGPKASVFLAIAKSQEGKGFTYEIWKEIGFSKWEVNKITKELESDDALKVRKIVPNGFERTRKNKVCTMIYE